MPFFKQIELDGVLIGVWKLTEQIEELMQNFLDEELNDSNFRKYSHSKRKTEWLSSRVLLRKMIGKDAKISYLLSGKPLLEQSIYKNISITHSKDFVAVILSMTRKVGIDIEDTTRDFDRIKQRYLSTDESQLAGNNQQLQCLFWCIKEAVFKLVGVEGVEFREQIRITPDEKEQNRFFTTFIDGDKRTTYPVNFEFFDESCLVWVVE